MFYSPLLVLGLQVITILFPVHALNLRGAEVVEDEIPRTVALTTLGINEALIVYQNWMNERDGKLRLGFRQGDNIALSKPLTFHSARLDNLALASLTGGHAVVAYRDWGNAGRGALRVIQRKQTTISASASLFFDEGIVDSISLISLSPELLLLSYRDLQEGGRGKMRLVSMQHGELLVGTAVTFSQNDIASIAAAAYGKDTAIVTYQDITNGGRGTAQVVHIRSDGITLGDPLVFHPTRTVDMSIGVLDPYRSIVGFTDAGKARQGLVTIIDRTGMVLRKKETHLFSAGMTSDTSIHRIHKTGATIAYRDTSNAAKGMFRVLTIHNNVAHLTTEKPFSGPGTSDIVLKADNGSTLFFGFRSANGIGLRVQSLHGEPGESPPILWSHKRTAKPNGKAEVTLTFSEPIYRGDGMIEVYNKEDGKVISTFSVHSPSVQRKSDDSVAIDIDVPKGMENSIDVAIDDGAFVDGNSNHFKGTKTLPKNKAGRGVPPVTPRVAIEIYRRLRLDGVSGNSPSQEENFFLRNGSPFAQIPQAEVPAVPAPSGSSPTIPTPAAPVPEEPEEVTVTITEPEPIITDQTPPTILRKSIPDGSRVLSFIDEITLIFSEPVYPQQGAMTIFDQDGNFVERIDVGSHRVSGGGTDRIVLKLSAPLKGGEYRIALDSGTFADESQNLFDGIHESKWAFTILGHIILALPSGAEAVLRDDGIDVTELAQYGIQTLRIVDDGKLIAEFSFDFDTGNHDFSTVFADRKDSSYATVLHNLSSHTGVVGNITMFILYGSGHQFLRYCPGYAEARCTQEDNWAAVWTATGKVYAVNGDFDPSPFSVKLIRYDGQKLWRVHGPVASSGQSEGGDVPEFTWWSLCLVLLGCGWYVQRDETLRSLFMQS